jgi:hypothetical protein
VQHGIYVGCKEQEDRTWLRPDSARCWKCLVQHRHRHARAKREGVAKQNHPIHSHCVDTSKNWQTTAGPRLDHNTSTPGKVLPRQGVCPVHGVICGRLATIPEGSTVHSMVRENLRGAADIQVVRSPEQRSQRTASRFDTSWQDKQTQIV